AEVGARGAPFYGMTQVGGMGVPCPEASAVDDVHLLTYKVGVVQRSTPVGRHAHVDALFLTSLLPTSPKLMLNVESGDYGRIEERSCGCAFGELGFHQHLYDIRSHEKLTAEGMTFLGEDLIAVVEHVLPERF